MGTDDTEGVAMYHVLKYVNVRFGTFVVLVLFCLDKRPRLSPSYSLFFILFNVY